MKKLVSLLLMLLLPLLLVTANAMSMQMALSSVQSQSSQPVQASMPCHQVIQSQTMDQSKSNNINTCVECGLCAISGAINEAGVIKALPIHAATNLTPIFFAPVFHSQTYPPAIKPPILN